MSNPLAEFADVFFNGNSPNKAPKEIRITLSELQARRLQEGKTLTFRAGKQTVVVQKER